MESFNGNPYRKVVFKWYLQDITTKHLTIPSQLQLDPTDRIQKCLKYLIYFYSVKKTVTISKSENKTRIFGKGR